jgi:hypothetical protein
MNFSRKDLILLQKYKDDNYKRALVEHIVSLAKYEVFRLAIKGETMARISNTWASTEQELQDLRKEEQQVIEQVKAVFPDSTVEMETNKISLFFYEFWEIVVKVNWG